MIDETQLLALLADLESFRVERTISTDNKSKFGEAICAFANDMPGSRLPGYLLIGADDKTGQPSGLNVSDQLLQYLAGFASDGNILPAPALVAYTVALSSGLGDIAVVEVQPSDIPPVRYQGKVYIRRGPRRGVANETEERLLAERRVAGHLTFDAQACVSSDLTDLAADLFTTGYRPFAIDPEVIAENARPLEVQMASLRFFDLARNCPTHAGILLFGSNPLYFEQFAFVQYVRYEGVDAGSDVVSDRFFSGDLLSLLRDLDRFAKEIPVSHPVEASALRETVVYDYPPAALREVLMNAVMHRAYDQPSGVRVLHFADRLEIISPGPLYGLATPTNFPRQTSYRNPVIAEAMKVLGFVNRFGRGVARAQSALAANSNPPARFEFGDTFFAAIIEARPVKTIAFFNNKGGVGKTTLVYHLAHMLAERGHEVLAVDLDPQANLSAMCLDEDRMEKLWVGQKTVYAAIRPLLEGTGDVETPHLEPIVPGLNLVVGDLDLSGAEDELSSQWPRCLESNPRAFRIISSFWRIITKAAETTKADLVLIDVGPNLGAINRAALIAAEHVVIPLAPDLFSLEGLKSLGPTLRNWRSGWEKRRGEATDIKFSLPSGIIRPIGYVVLQHGIRISRPVQAYQRWITRMPGTYREAVLGENLGTRPAPSAAVDPYCLAMLKHYRSLMPLAMEAHKPMFRLKPADGAIGAHVTAVGDCYDDFFDLAQKIGAQIGVSVR